MKVHVVLTHLIIALFLLSSSLLAAERTPEWYEERGLVSETEIREIPHTGSRTMREIPEGGILLIPDSSGDRVMGFDPISGDLIDANFIPPHSDYLSTPIHIVMNAEGTGLLITDQLADLVQKFSFDGVYEGIFAPIGGVNNNILDNIRGMYIRDDGHALVTVASGGNAHAIAEFDTDGNYLGNFIDNNAGGMAGPWSIIYRPDFDDYLVSTSTSNAIHRFDSDGISLGYFVPSLNFPEQLYETSEGNILAATFSTPSGVYEYDSSGTQIGYYGVVTGLRGVYELGNGNILVTNGSGVYEIDRNNTIVDTKITGVNARFISFVGPSIGYGIPFEEDFEDGSLPEDWEQEHIEGSIDWSYQDGGHMGNPSSAFEGDFNAFYRSDVVGDSTVLITPPLLISNAVNPLLRFQHAQAAWAGSQDELNVYYKIGEEGDWILLESYDSDVPEWTEREIELPDVDDLCYIGFEAVSGGGYGVCIDLVEVFDHIYPIMEVTPLEFNVVLLEGESTVEILTIGNVGTDDLEYEIDILEPAGWLTVSEPTGTIEPGGSIELELLIDSTGLEGDEDYSATLIVSDNYFDMEVNVVVNLHVEALVLNPPQNLEGLYVWEPYYYTVDLSWDVPVNGRNRAFRSRELLGYNVYRQILPEGDFDLINTEIVSALYYTDEDVDFGEDYAYYVTAVYTEGESEPSNSIEINIPDAQQVAQPTASPEPGEYEDSVTVELLCDTEEAEIRFTLNGEDPDEGSMLYEEPLELTEDTVIKARAYKSLYLPSEMLEAEYTIVVSAEDTSEIAPVTGLYPAFPNPFNPSTTISFSLADEGMVTLELFNARGQKIRTLVREWREAGNHSVIWNGRDEQGNPVRSGIYFYRMTAEDYETVKKMMLIQ